MSSTTVSSILKFLDNQNFEIDDNQNMESRPKKRRLDHLTWEEKMQRKKLKNRVAAQTSRDRKKAKMDQMEQALQQLISKNETVLQECENLKLTNERLQKENEELHKRLQAPCLTCNSAQSRSVGCETLNGSTEFLLPPKGRVTYPAASLSKHQAMILLKVILVCFLYRTCSTNLIQMSTSTHWSNSLKVSYKISPEIWKSLLREQMKKNQKSMEIVLRKWWGKHQQSWNPVEVMM